MEKIIEAISQLLTNSVVAPYLISFLGLAVAGFGLYVALVAIRHSGKSKS